jgi:hypothetical protein
MDWFPSYLAGVQTIVFPSTQEAICIGAFRHQHHWEVLPTAESHLLSIWLHSAQDHGFQRTSPWAFPYALPLLRGHQSPIQISGVLTAGAGLQYVHDGECICYAALEDRSPTPPHIAELKQKHDDIPYLVLMKGIAAPGNFGELWYWLLAEGRGIRLEVDGHIMTPPLEHLHPSFAQWNQALAVTVQHLTVVEGITIWQRVRPAL